MKTEELVEMYAKGMLTEHGKNLLIERLYQENQQVKQKFQDNESEDGNLETGEKIE